MSAPDVCAAALRQGLNPCEIAHAQGISLSTVFGFLDRAVGEDKIARSEIYFSMPQALRVRVEKACRETDYRYSSDVSRPPVVAELNGLLASEDPGEVQVCLRYGPASRYYGDLYEDVRRYELDLHKLVRDALVAKFGTEERRWWFQGVPLKVRIDCSARAETVGRWDLEPWSCTMMLDLQTVIEQRWAIFSPIFKAPSKNDVSSEIKKVNEVRNRVMHPVRDSPPTDADFDELDLAYRRLQQARVAFYGLDVAQASRAR